jgi:predicted amidophosphoribosyltransferase
MHEKPRHSPVSGCAGCRVDFERIECPKCGEKFLPGAKE